MLNAKAKVQLAGRSNLPSLLRELTITEFKLKYQGSVIGYFWSLIKPLAIFGVLYLVFTVLVRVGAGIPHYPVYLLVGIVLWNYFAESTLNATRAIVDKGDLIRKVYFPRIVILLASSFSALITLALNLVVIAVFLAIARISPGISWLAFPILLVELYLLSLGVSFFLSALYVRFRDFIYIWEVILQLLFYASAVIFPLSLVPIRFQKLLTLNPITQILQDSRKALINPNAISTIDLHRLPLLLLPYLVPVVLAVAGYWFFERSAARFAEEV